MCVCGYHINPFHFSETAIWLKQESISWECHPHKVSIRHQACNSFCVTNVVFKHQLASDTPIYCWFLSLFYSSAFERSFALCRRLSDLQLLEVISYNSYLSCLKEQQLRSVLNIILRKFLKPTNSINCLTQNMNLWDGLVNVLFYESVGVDPNELIRLHLPAFSVLEISLEFWKWELDRITIFLALHKSGLHEGVAWKPLLKESLRKSRGDTATM